MPKQVLVLCLVSLGAFALLPMLSATLGAGVTAAESETEDPVPVGPTIPINMIAVDDPDPITLVPEDGQIHVL